MSNWTFTGEVAHRTLGVLALRLVSKPMKISPYERFEIELRGKRSMSPDQARSLAIELLYAADEAEGEETLGSFGYTAEDSYKLGDLYQLIDEELGWEDDEQEIDQDYRARIKQVGLLMKRRLRLVKP